MSITLDSLKRATQQLATENSKNEEGLSGLEYLFADDIEKDDEINLDPEPTKDGEDKPEVKGDDEAAPAADALSDLKEVALDAGEDEVLSAGPVDLDDEDTVLDLSAGKKEDEKPEDEPKGKEDDKEKVDEEESGPGVATQGDGENADVGTEADKDVPVTEGRRKHCKKVTVHVYDIDWDVEEEDVVDLVEGDPDDEDWEEKVQAAIDNELDKLPTSMDIDVEYCPGDDLAETISDAISKQVCWLHNGFNFDVIEGEEVDECDESDSILVREADDHTSVSFTLSQDEADKIDSHTGEGADLVQQKLEDKLGCKVKDFDWDETDRTITSDGVSITIDCFDISYEGDVDESSLGDAFKSIGQGIGGLLKTTLKGVGVLIAGLGGSFLFGLPGLLIAVCIAFGLMSAKEGTEVKVNEGLLGNIKDKLKAAIGTLKVAAKNPEEFQKEFPEEEFGVKNSKELSDKCKADKEFAKKVADKIKQDFNPGGNTPPKDDKKKPEVADDEAQQVAENDEDDEQKKSHTYCAYFDTSVPADVFAEGYSITTDEGDEYAVSVLSQVTENEAGDFPLENVTKDGEDWYDEFNEILDKLMSEDRAYFADYDDSDIEWIGMEDDEEEEEDDEEEEVDEDGDCCEFEVRERHGEFKRSKFKKDKWSDGPRRKPRFDDEEDDYSDDYDEIDLTDDEVDAEDLDLVAEEIPVKQPEDPTDGEPEAIPPEENPDAAKYADDGVEVAAEQTCPRCGTEMDEEPYSHNHRCPKCKNFIRGRAQDVHEEITVDGLNALDGMDDKVKDELTKRLKKDPEKAKQDILLATAMSDDNVEEHYDLDLVDDEDDFGDGEDEVFVPGSGPNLNKRRDSFSKRQRDRFDKHGDFKGPRDRKGKPRNNVEMAAETRDVSTSRQLQKFLKECNSFKKSLALRKSVAKFTKLMTESPRKAQALVDQLDHQFKGKPVSERRFCKAFVKSI